jgi:parvulin-like peptidyl-prolyl isomerase
MRRLFVLLLLHSVLGAAGAHAEIIERIIVKVNGEIITLSEFQERQIAAAQAARVPPEQIGNFLRQSNARLLQQAIDEVLLLQKAEDSGLQLPPEYIDEIIESIKKENNVTTEEQFQAALAQEGMTLDELRESIRKSYTRQMIVRREVEPRISVSEEQVLEEYEKRKATDFTKSATVTLQEIFVAEEIGGITLANEIVARARGGEDFASLARTHSAGPTASTGGELGEIAQGDLNPDLEKTAFALSVGSVTDPIAVEGGYRILRVLAKTTGSVVPFANAKQRIRNEMMGTRFDKEYEVYIAEVREDADIELRVREVPLQLSGPVPEDTLLNDVDPFSLGPVTPGSTLASPAASAPAAPAAPGAATPATPNPFAAPGPDDEFVTTPQARPERITPGGLDDEISTTPQAGPERVAPPASPRPDPPETSPPPE